MPNLINDRNIHSIKRDLLNVGVLIGIIWIVFVLDRILPLETLGLVPRTPGGLIGILTMPFLHADFAHLVGNTMPLAVTLLLLAGSRANSMAIAFIITVCTGVGLWLFGRSALHIGASGVVFGLIAFHIFAGVFEKRLQSTVLAIVVCFLYASTTLQGIVPFQQGVSWEGHLIGATTGGLVALLISRTLRQSTANQAP